MRRIDFIKLSPGGNTTILVSDPARPGPGERSAIANQLLDPLHLGGEQVGYIDLAADPPSLMMMGGEFCGNASRSLAAVLAWKGHPSCRPGGRGLTGRVRVSGAKAPLAWRAEPSAKGFEVWVEMPTDRAATEVRDLALEGKPLTAVFMPGICHLMLPVALFPFPALDPAGRAREIRQELGLADREAVGCVWHGGGGAAGEHRIDPVVWVRDTDSTYHETACGSGTAALGLMLARLGDGPVAAAVRQPSGSLISVTVSRGREGGPLDRVWIGGEVVIVAEGGAFLPD